MKVSEFITTIVWLHSCHNNKQPHPYSTGTMWCSLPWQHFSRGTR